MYHSPTANPNSSSTKIERLCSSFLRRKYEIIFTIIGAIGGILAGTIGVGYFRFGVFKDLTKTQAMILTIVGGSIAGISIITIIYLKNSDRAKNPNRLSTKILLNSHLQKSSSSTENTFQETPVNQNADCADLNRIAPQRTLDVNSLRENESSDSARETTNENMQQATFADSQKPPLPAMNEDAIVGNHNPQTVPLMILPYGGKFFHINFWDHYRVQIPDAVPSPPNISWDSIDPYFGQPYKENYTLIYIPKNIVYNGEILPVTLHTLDKICSYFSSSKSWFQYNGDTITFDASIHHPLWNQIKDQTINSGWILISNQWIHNSSQLSYNDQATLLKNNEHICHRMPHALEVAVFNLMVKATKCNRWNGAAIGSRCLEFFSTENLPVIVNNNQECFLLDYSQKILQNIPDNPFAIDLVEMRTNPFRFDYVWRDTLPQNFGTLAVLHLRNT